MISLVIASLYFIVMVFFVLFSFFIVYHLARYSINRELQIVMLSLFIIVFSGLFFANLLLFFAIDWTALLLSITL